MPAQPPPASASDLCTRCGICCSGAIFDYGDLSEAETSTVEKAGLRVTRINGKARFHLPCPRFADNRCTVYEVRPAVCRAYQCELLKGYLAGEVSAEEAQGRIAEAHALIGQVRETMPEGKDLASVREDWARDHGEGAAAGASASADPQRTLSLFMLNRFLDRYFRKAHQRMMSGWEVEERRSE